MEQNKGLNRTKLVIGGHRGHKSDVRENTIANFEQIKGLGISYIEIDVQLTKDEQAVIYHDFDLSLKTSLQGMVRDYTLQQIRQSFEICTLEEAVDWCKENTVGLALEIKMQPYTMWEDREILAERIAKTIACYEFYSNCFVFGADYGLLSMIKKMNPVINIGLIVPFIPADPVKLMKEMEAVVYLNYVEQLSPSLVKELHEAGYLVDGSVINTKERLIIAQQLGVDLIESDNPELILELLEAENAG